MLDVYPAREEPVGPLAGVSGLDVARAAADHAGGRPVWWLVTPSAPSGPSLRGCARATCWSRSAPGTSTAWPTGSWEASRTAVEIPGNVQADYPLARLTTVRAGGSADLFARPDER